jgi:hypothetical protein
MIKPVPEKNEPINNKNCCGHKHSNALFRINSDIITRTVPTAIWSLQRIRNRSRFDLFDNISEPSIKPDTLDML